MKPTEALYQQDGKYYFRNEKGQINTIVVNKFNDKEIVKATKKHHSKTTFVMLIDPIYIESRGWVYGMNYIDRQGNRGGSSFAWREDEFEKIDNPRDILYSKRLYLKEQILDHKNQLKQYESELEKIEYTLSISVPEWNLMVKDCKECGKLFHGHGKGGDYNRDLCCDCNVS